MILYRETHKIKYVALDSDSTYYSWDPNSVKKVEFKDYVSLTDLGTAPEKYCYCNTYSYSCTETPRNAKGIYLGDVESIRNEINKKLNPVGPDKFAKVYFDPNCKYPRFKLSSLTDIKRCLDPSKADTVIISDPTINNYISRVRTIYKKFKEVLILYSTTENCYYLIDYCPDKLINRAEDPKFQSLFSKYADIKEVGLRRWSSALINSKVLPSDCKEFYSGKVVLTHTDEETQFINNLFTKYMLLTYDTELDRFIANGLQKPTDEDLQTLQRIFASTDNSVVDMGLKLLSNYDLSSHVCSVGIILANSWGNINSSRVSRSVGFTQVLSSLGLRRQDLNTYNVDDIINVLYKKSNNPQDKERARNIIAQKISEAIEKEWKAKYAKKFNNFNFTFKFTIE